MWGQSMLQSNIYACTNPEQRVIQFTGKLRQLLLIFIPKTLRTVTTSFRVTVFPITHWTGRFSFFIFCLFLSDLKLTIFENIELPWSIEGCQLRFRGFGWRTYNSFGTRVEKGLNQTRIKPICSRANYDPIPPSSNLQLRWKIMRNSHYLSMIQW